MKILIGTPIHQCKDYAIEKWLKCISELTYPHDLLMVDNSSGTVYSDKVKGYCKKLEISNYKIKHIEFPPDTILEEKLACSRENIRQEVLSSNYDAWCSIECDTIFPPDALSKLVDLLGEFQEVNHSYPCRGQQNEFIAEFGLSLIKREILEKNGFLNEYGYCDPNMPNSWNGGERWFMKRNLLQGGKMLDVYGVIKPIFHLDKNTTNS